MAITRNLLLSHLSSSHVIAFIYIYIIVYNPSFMASTIWKDLLYIQRKVRDLFSYTLE